MASTVSALAASAALELGPPVPWGELPPCDSPGVYLIALDRDAQSTEHAVQQCPIDLQEVSALLSVRKDLTVDGIRPNAAQLAARISSFWIPSETVVYIGLAGGSVATRIGQYYKTKLGARSPHAGGWFLKVLSKTPPRWVHWAAADNAATAEQVMLQAFCEGVSPEECARLHDPEHPLPFANLEWPRGVRKLHGIAGAKEARARRPAAPRQVRPPSASAGLDERPKRAGHSLQSQGVTLADRAAGQIRVPARTKHIFPAEAGPIRVFLRGRELQGRWNPRMGPDRERSGTIRLDRMALDELVAAGQVLVVGRRPDGSFNLQ